MKKIEQLKKGDFFKLKAESKSVYVYEGYCRFNKAYVYSRFDDINAFGKRKKGTMVVIDFDF